MMRPLPFLATSLAALLLVGPSWAQRGRSQAPTVVRAADADRDGEVTTEEWDALVAAVRGPDGSIDTELLMARILASLLDRDDALVTPNDVRLRLEAIDANRDGLLAADEIMPDWRSFRGGDVDFGSFFAGAVLAVAGDANGDGTLDQDEAFQLLATIELDAAGSVSSATLIDWIAAAQVPVSEDRGAFTPGVFLLTISAGLDADRNGAVDEADMRDHFARVDADASGTASVAELAPRRPGSGSGARGSTGAGSNAPGSDATATETTDGTLRRSKPLMPWQRNLDDALAMSKRTGKPLLICVNMDNESASESLATSRYRDPAFVELVDGFIPLLASPDRHSLLDYDDRGRRIPDPRFGRLVEDEHLLIEPELYRRYFNGQRVAPRHVGVAPDGKILFDLYLLSSLSQIDTALRKHGRPGTPIPAAESLSEGELLMSPDAGHRDHLEQLFVESDVETRRRLTTLALSDERETQHPELVRLALRDPDEGVRLQAIWTMVQFIERTPMDLLEEAFSVSARQPGATGPLMEATRRLAANAPLPSVAQRAQSLVAVHAGLELESTLLDQDAWSLELSWAAPESPVDPATESPEALVARLEEIDRLLADRPGDRSVHLAFAAMSMRFARQQMAVGRNPSFLLDDVIRGAEQATSEERPDGRALALIAWAKWNLSDFEGAAAAAESAAPHLLPWASSPLGLYLLEVVADTRTRSIYRAIGDREALPESEVADARAAHELLIQHPNATADHVLTYLNFLGGIGATGHQEAALRRALSRFTEDDRLHAFLRNQQLRDHGAVALEASYREITFEPGTGPSVEWYWGLATLMVAERFVQVGDTQSALAAYARSVERFRASMEAEPDYTGSASHYICLALAGAARIQVDSGRLDAAVDSLREGVVSSPTSVLNPDGLGNTPKDNAEYVVSALRVAGRAEEARTLKVTLAEEGVELGG